MVSPGPLVHRLERRQHASPRQLLGGKAGTRARHCGGALQARVSRVSTGFVRHTSRAGESGRKRPEQGAGRRDRAAARGVGTRRLHSCAGASRGSHPRPLKPMLPGFSGHLISESFLERYLESSLTSGSSEPGRHRLSRCRERVFLARASLEPARAAGSRSRAALSRAGVCGARRCRAAERHPRGDAVERVGARRADRCTVGTTARRVMAGRRRVRAKAGSLLVPPLQRRPCTGHRNEPPVFTPPRAVRPRRDARRRTSVGGAPDGPQGIVVFNGRRSAGVCAPPPRSGPRKTTRRRFADRSGTVSCRPPAMCSVP